MLLYLFRRWQPLTQVLGGRHILCNRSIPLQNNSARGLRWIQVKFFYSRENVIALVTAHTLFPSWSEFSFLFKRTPSAVIKETVQLFSKLFLIIACSVHFCACLFWRTKMESGQEHIQSFVVSNELDPEVWYCVPFLWLASTNDLEMNSSQNAN